jgi:plastocyanin
MRLRLRLRSSSAAAAKRGTLWRLRGLAAVLALVGALAATPATAVFAADTDSAGIAAVTGVLMINRRFVPAARTVQASDTVVWINAVGGLPHTVTSDTGVWPSSPILRAGDTFRLTFDTPGTIPYYCVIHSGMRGRIVVQ